jgi:hypothetical protein
VGLEPTSLQAGASFQDWFLSQFGAPHPKEEQRKAKESGEKRRGWDSNPRGISPNTLAVCRFRPLSHLSIPISNLYNSLFLISFQMFWVMGIENIKVSCYIYKKVPVVQWIEHLVADQKVRGSTPLGDTAINFQSPIINQSLITQLSKKYTLIEN